VGVSLRFTQQRSVATTLNNLAVLFRASAGRPKPSGSTNIFERALPADHPNLRACRGNYAAVIREIRAR
jgi:hypothetical protein